MPIRPDGGFDLDDDAPTPYLEPLSEEDRARMRAAGLTDDEIANLDRVRLTEIHRRTIEKTTRLPDART